MISVFQIMGYIYQDSLEKSQAADFQPLGRWKTSPQVGCWADPYSKTKNCNEKPVEYFARSRK